MMLRTCILVAMAVAVQGSANEYGTPGVVVDVPPPIREWYHNFPSPEPATRGEGSCVQCSIGILGADQVVPSAATLLWDSEYGPAVYGGSYPSRVAEYARQRGIRIYNVTGNVTYDWMRWAVGTGRGVAIGFGQSHFQTLMGYEPVTGTWYVCDNNSPSKITAYSDDQFRRLHEASGKWCVILDYPPHPARPQYLPWWLNTREIVR